MSIVARTQLRQAYGSLSNIFELGDYYAIGSQILRKDLTPVSANNQFHFPVSAAGLDVFGWANYSNTYANKTKAPLNLSGSSANLYCDAASGSTGKDSQSVPTNCGTYTASLKSYIDSTMGLTAGRRVVFWPSAEQVVGGYVSDSGAVDWQGKFSPVYNQSYGRISVLTETSGFIYLLMTTVGVGSAYNSTTLSTQNVRHGTSLVIYNKSTGLGTYPPYMDYNSGTTSTWCNAFIRYLGKTDDGKLWFGRVTPFATANASYLIWAFDTSNNSLYYPSQGTEISNGGLFKMSDFTVQANDPTKYKAYLTRDNASTSSMGLDCYTVPKAGRSISGSGFTPPSKVACTITGGVLPAPYSAVGGGLNACDVDCWTFTDSGNEYVAIYSHANQAANSVVFSQNKCPASLHCLTVLKIDPTNPANLLHMGATTDSGFGTGQMFSSLVLSVDGKTVVAGNDGGFVVLRFNPATSVFEYSPYNAVVWSRMVLDQNSQLWVEDFDRNLSVFSLTGSNNTVIDFDTPVITYSSTPVDCNAKVSNYNLYGVRQAVPVTLQITGAVFKANGLKTITVTTSASADVLVPITVNSYNSVVVTTVSS